MFLTSSKLHIFDGFIENQKPHYQKFVSSYNLEQNLDILKKYTLKKKGKQFPIPAIKIYNNCSRF